MGNGGRYLSVLAGPLAILYLLYSYRDGGRRLALEIWRVVSPFAPWLAACAIALLVHTHTEVGDPFTRMLWAVPIALAAQRIGLRRSAVFTAAAWGSLAYLATALRDVVYLDLPRGGVGVNEVVFAQTATLCAGLALIGAVFHTSAPRSSRLAWLIAAIGGIGAVALSGSRGPLLALFTLAMAIGLHGMRRGHAREALVTLFLLGAAATAILATTPLSERLMMIATETRDYFATPHAPITSIGIRLELWKIALEAGAADPFFGPGYLRLAELSGRFPQLGFLPPDLLQLTPHFHADWAHALVAGGLVLLGGLVASMTALAWSARHDPAKLWLICAMAIFGLSDLAFFTKASVSLFFAAWVLLVPREDAVHG